MFYVDYSFFPNFPFQTVDSVFVSSTCDNSLKSPPMSPSSITPRFTTACLSACPPQPIDYEGFQLFMATYLENDIPEELCQHLFTSFKSKTGGSSPEAPRSGAGMLGRSPPPTEPPPPQPKTTPQ